MGVWEHVSLSVINFNHYLITAHVIHYCPSGLISWSLSDGTKVMWLDAWYWVAIICNCKKKRRDSLMLIIPRKLENTQCSRGLASWSKKIVKNLIENAYILPCTHKNQVSDPFMLSYGSKCQKMWFVVVLISNTTFWSLWLCEVQENQTCIFSLCQLKVATNKLNCIILTPVCSTLPVLLSVDIIFITQICIPSYKIQMTNGLHKLGKSLGTNSPEFWA